MSAGESTQKIMGRWKPDARNRIEEAALELFIERGFEGATTAEIAARAGLTERTFFRHFADKREVLFGRQEQLQTVLVDAIIAAPADLGPLEAVTWGIGAGAGAFFEAHRDAVLQRQAVLETVVGLREREMLKMATLCAAMAGALRERGTPVITATLSAEMGITVFRVAFDRWIEPANERAFAQLVGEALDQLRAVTATP